MNIEKTIHGLMGLDECWEVRGVDYDSETEKFFMVITETDKLWEKEVCPHQSCKSTGITCYDHSKTRSWRHMDVFGKRSEILCNVPCGKCPICHRTYRVKVPWEVNSPFNKCLF